MLDKAKKVISKAVRSVADALDSTGKAKKDKSNDEDKVLIRGLHNVTIDDDADSKLQIIRQKFNICFGAWNQQIFDEREEIYDGTHEVDLNINEKRRDIETKLSNQPYNIVYELIESQVENTIPQPTIKSKRAGMQYLAKMVEDSIKNDLIDTKVNKVNDKNERTTFKHGFSATEVVWDAGFTHPRYIGEIQLRQRHPKSFIPQIGIWDIDDMDYCFTTVTTTKQAAYQEFGIPLDMEYEQYPQVNNVGGQLANNNLLEKVTIITCWYKDAESDVGKFTWVNNKVLEDLPKYFYRRPIKCTECGQAQEHDNQKKCECGGKFTRSLQMTEVLVEDKVLQRTQQVQDPMTGQMIEQPIVIPKGTEIPYFAPKRFPVIIRVNVPSDFGFGGISDIDVIRDKYMAISKLMNNIEEKLTKAGYLIAVPTDLKINITTNIFQIVRGTQQDLAGINIKDLSFDIQKDLEAVKTLYEQAKNLLGITDAFMGRPDPTAKSGIAKQLQVAQSSGRMASKQFNKFDFYKQLFEMMFYFKLAFYDELRPVVSKDDTGNDKYFDFDKYEFLIQGEDGKWFYNTDFIFTVDNTGGWERNRDFMYQQTMQLFQQGAFNPSFPAIMLWQMLDNLNFPNAGGMKQAIQQELNTQQQMQQMQEQIKQLQQQLQSTQQPPQQIPQQDQSQGQPQENPYQALTDSLSPDELEHLEKYPNEVLNELNSINQTNQQT